jgi:ribonuclease BN (tRNA processing enzyme)
MNSSTLQKLEKGYIQLDWKEYINRVDLTKAHMETIIDIVDMLPCFVNQGIHRRKFYKKLQFNIEVYEVEDSKIVAKIDLNNTVDISELKNIKIKNENVDFIDD